MPSFLVRQIVMAIKKEKTLTYLTFIDNRPEAFSETRLSDKDLWDAGFSVKTDTILKKNVTRHLP